MTQVGTQGMIHTRESIFKVSKLAIRIDRYYRSFRLSNQFNRILINADNYRDLFKYRKISNNKIRMHVNTKEKGE